MQEGPPPRLDWLGENWDEDVVVVPIPVQQQPSGVTRAPRLQTTKLVGLLFFPEKFSVSPYILKGTQPYSSYKF